MWWNTACEIIKVDHISPAFKKYFHTVSSSSNCVCLNHVPCLKLILFQSVYNKTANKFVLLHSLCYPEAEQNITNSIWSLKCFFLHHTPDFLRNLATRTSGSSSSSCSKTHEDFNVKGGNFILSINLKLIKSYIYFIQLLCKSLHLCFSYEFSLSLLFIFLS